MKATSGINGHFILHHKKKLNFFLGLMLFACSFNMNLGHIFQMQQNWYFKKSY